MANEKRLIDANALKEKLQDHHDFFIDGVGGLHYLTPKDKARVDEITHCIAEIVNAPTVDAVEVVHGRWIGGYQKAGNTFYYEKPHCSICGVKHEGVANYCPQCGAKMDGDGNGS